MSQVTICLTAALCLFLIMNIDCAVIKMQEIPINKNVVMKIIVKEDGDGDSVATIKILMDHKKKHDKELQPVKLIDKFVKPTGDFIPQFNDRNGIINGNCPLGKVRRGPICTVP